MSPAPTLRSLLALGCLTAAMLAFEVGLTRVIALQHWHHLASLIIALALLGFGCAGVLAALRPGWLADSLPVLVPVLALLFCLSVPASLWLSARPPLIMPAYPWETARQTLLLTAYTAAFLPPFLLTALLISAYFLRWPERSGRVYASDLAGSALGAVLALVILSVAGLAMLFLLCIGLAALAALVTPWHRLRWGVAPLVAVMSVALLPDIQPNPDKALSQRLSQAGVSLERQRDTAEARYSLVSGPGLHSAPGLSMNSGLTPPPADQLFDDGHFRGALHQDLAPEFYRRSLWSAPFQLIDPERVVIAGMDGNWATRLAAVHQATSIEVLDSGTGLIDWARTKVLGDWPETARFRPTSLRRFLEADNEPRDLFLIPLRVPEAGLAAAQQHYELTRRATRRLFLRLSEDGMAAFVVSLRPVPSSVLRLVSTWLPVLEEARLEPDRHLVIVRDWRSAVVMVSRRPVTPAALAALRDWTERCRFDWVAAPGLTADATNRFHQRQYDLFDPLQRLLAEPERFIDRYPLRIEPVTDNRPFPHHFTRLDRLDELRRVAGPMGHLYLDWGYLLHWGALAAVLILASVLIGLPAALAGSGPGTGFALGYFALIGLAFMFAEIAFLYRAWPLLDTTTTGFTCIVASFLLGTGIGSLAMDRYRPTLHTGATILAVGGLLLPAFAALVGVLLPVAADWSGMARFGLMAVLSGLLAIPLGVALPGGIRALHGHGRTIAWAWASNGFASVAGSVGAVLVALHLGLNGLTLAASTLYLGAAFALMARSRRL